MRCRLGSGEAEIAGAAFQQVLGEIQNDCYDTKLAALKAGDVVVDIGAHIGLFSCYVALNYPEVRVLAYEPAAANYEHLIRNIAPFPQITAYRVALGDGSPLRLQYRRLRDYCSSAFYESHLADGAYEMAYSLTLDEILTPHERVALLKMDCEGAEWQALLTSKLLDERVEHLRMELHHLPQFDALKTSLKQRLQDFAGRNYQRLRINEVDKLHSEGLAA
ncbi:MAG: FkbM family methyltransferase [Alphaproteobacteria bacterium]|nr:FkbM family methyltransferase [Alphaproteobacteria bacterium]